VNLKDELAFEKWWNENNEDTDEEEKQTKSYNFLKEQFKRAWTKACKYKEESKEVE
jgi:hypothetical protein